MAFGQFLLGSHNLMVTALGSCVKWDLSYGTQTLQTLESKTYSTEPSYLWSNADTFKFIKQCMYYYHIQQPQVTKT